MVSEKPEDTKRGHQNPEIEGRQTTDWPMVKRQKDKQQTGQW